MCAPIREILKVTEQPGIISIAGGLPAPELFPVAEIDSATSVFWARTALPVRCNTAPPKDSHSRANRLSAMVIQDSFLWG